MRRQMGGYTLMEVLVAVLVMGVGVLGITGLQMLSLQNNRAALMRTEAVQQAYDMLDRIRANPGVGAAGVAYGGLDMGDAPPSAQNCVSNNCSPAQMVQFDQAMWKCSLGIWKTDATCVGLVDDEILRSAQQQPGLINGDGSVVVDGSSGVISVTVQWSDGQQTRSVTIDSQG
ncbi:MAG: type IV pilus modification protein PilV [Proteobacteria bacterium]|nr:type IV pilus modification protein PilV [Pseudomonadota bacterium]